MDFDNQFDINTYLCMFAFVIISFSLSLIGIIVSKQIDDILCFLLLMDAVFLFNTILFIFKDCMN
jgi:hypothetical protein